MFSFGIIKTHTKRVTITWQSSACCVLSRSVILCDPMNCRPPGSSVHGDSPGKNTGVGCHALLQGIFPSQRSNPGLPHCGQILYQLSHQGSPRILEAVAYPFSRGSSWSRNRTRASCVAGRFFTNWNREAPPPKNKEQGGYNLLKAEEQSQDSWYSVIFVPQLPPWSQVVTFRRPQMPHIKHWGHYTKISFILL